MKKETQCDKVLRFMREHGSITTADTVSFGCYRLAARIADLKNMGFEIRSITEQSKKENGRHFTRYSLKE